MRRNLSPAQRLSSRRLTSVQTLSAKEMFIRTNFHVLEVAIEQVTRAESSVLKHRGKNGLVPVHIPRVPG